MTLMKTFLFVLTITAIKANYNYVGSSRPIDVTSNDGFQFTFETGDILNATIHFISFEKMPRGVTHYNLYTVICHHVDHRKPCTRIGITDMARFEMLNESYPYTFEFKDNISDFKLNIDLIQEIEYNKYGRNYTKIIINASDRTDGIHDDSCLFKQPCDIYISLDNTERLTPENWSAFASSFGSQRKKWQFCTGGIDNADKKEKHFIWGTVGYSKQFKCEKQRNKNLWHYQLYNNYKLFTDISFEATPDMKLTQSILHLTVEHFDNATELHCVQNTTNDFKQNISIADNESIKNYKIDTTLPYSEKKYVNFSCEQYHAKYVIIGLINTTANVIEAYQMRVLTKVFDRTYNNSILCCVYYLINEYTVTRYVENKTSLFYDPNPMENDNDDGSLTYTIIYIISAVMIIIVFIIIIILIKKCSCTFKKNSELELETYATTRVQYVDLDIHNRPGNRPGPVPYDEEPYAQIIGVLKPA